MLSAAWAYRLIAAPIATSMALAVMSRYRARNRGRYTDRFLSKKSAVPRNRSVDTTAIAIGICPLHHAPWWVGAAGSNTTAITLHVATSTVPSAIVRSSVCLSLLAMECHLAFLWFHTVHRDAQPECATL